MSDSEEEYGPICATWGSQAPVTDTEHDTIDAWKTLQDPNIKLGPNDVGSGNLHRRGHNFKPIDEELILAHRNKLQVSINPKKKKKPANKKKPTTPEPTKSKPNTSSSHKKQDNIPPLTTIRPPPSQKHSTWSSSNLVETPFWEAQKATDNNVKKPLPSETKDTTTTITTPTTTKSPLFSESPIVDSGWGNSQTTTTTQQESRWEEYDKQKMAKTGLDVVSDGWSNVDKVPKQRNNEWSDWGKIESGGRGRTEKKKEDDSEKNSWSTWNSDKKTTLNKPSWIKSPQLQESSRFSIATKSRYISNIDVPEPVNYKRNGKPVIPTATAPPPPPENRRLITINVELSSNNKISVMIRELDDPLKLAQDFARNQNISESRVVESLTQLFTKQKEQALKLKNMKLQRRFPKPPQNPVYNNNNFPDYSAYESSPAYQNPSPTPFTHTATHSFARRAAYF